MTPKVRLALARRLVASTRALVSEPTGYEAWFEEFCEATLASLRDLNYPAENIATADLVCSFRLRPPKEVHANVYDGMKIVPGYGKHPLTVVKASGEKIAVSTSNMTPAAFAKRIIAGLQV